MVIDPEKVADAIREAAMRDVLPRFRTLTEGQIMEKAPGDFVTVADIEAERRLCRTLNKIDPGAHLLAEEMAARAGLNLEEYHTDEATWLIDPVDGTRNFARGELPFAIVVAYVNAGKCQLAWIYLPVEDRMVVAERGSGAWEIGQGRLAISTESSLPAMTGNINFRAFEDISPDRVKANAAIFSGLRNYRCAAFDFVQLARGNKHFSVYRRLWPWDHAAGILIFQEAGGHFALIDGRPYMPLQRVRGLLCAPSAASWHAIRDHLSSQG